MLISCEVMVLSEENVLHKVLLYAFNILTHSPDGSLALKTRSVKALVTVPTQTGKKGRRFAERYRSVTLQ
jgi:hypothetical protein